jgi:hypothetical protein
MYISVKIRNSIALILLLPYSVVRFEPGSAARQADATTAMPRRQGI